MSNAKVSQLYSVEYQEIKKWFHDNHPPYVLQDILKFNSIYKEAYPSLTREEKRRVEEFVDKLIEGVASDKLVTKIFGVV